MQGLPNCFHDSICFLQDLVIPEAQHTNALGIEEGCARLIITCLFSVLAAIQLHRKLVLVTIEIEDVTSNRMLAAKFCISNLTTAQQMPDKLFRIGLFFAHFARITFQVIRQFLRGMRNL